MESPEDMAAILLHLQNIAAAFAGARHTPEIKRKLEGIRKRLARSEFPPDIVVPHTVSDNNLVYALHVELPRPGIHVTIIVARFSGGYAELSVFGGRKVIYTKKDSILNEPGMPLNTKPMASLKELRTEILRLATLVRKGEL